MTSLGGRRTLGTVIGLAVVAVVFMTAVLGLAVSRGRTADYVFRDLAALCLEEPVGPLAAIVSNIGIMLWSGAAAMALVGWGALRRDESAREESRFLLAIGVLTALTAIDDQFQLHEGLLPSIGVPQKAYPVAYAVAVLVVLYVYRRVWTRVGTPFLLVSLLFLGLSAVSDTIADTLGLHVAAESAGEDALKFLGIVFWTAFVATSVVSRLRRGASVDRVGVEV